MYSESASDRRTAALSGVPFLLLADRDGLAGHPAIVGTDPAW